MLPVARSLFARRIFTAATKRGGTPMKKMIVTLGCAIGLALVGTGTSHAGVEQWTDGFEYNGNGPWWFAGIAGIDHGIGNAHTGNNNGWVRATSGWNAINTSVST